MNGAAFVAFTAVITSLPTLYARTLSYLEKALIVSMYWSSKFVDHAGESRSIEPFTGSDRSILSRIVLACRQTEVCGAAYMV